MTKPNSRDTAMKHFLSSVNYEIACEIMAGLSGQLAAKAHREEEQQQPDQARIAALRAESAAIWAEKEELTPENHNAIERTIWIYGLYLKGLLNS